MDSTTVLSGFIGSFLGVAAGFLGAVYLELNRNRRHRRSHLLALMREILSNNVRIRVLLKEGRREGSLQESAWQQLRVPLAGELKAELYNRIASRYDSLSHARQWYEQISADDDEPPTAPASLHEWADAMMEEHELMRAELGERDGIARALRRRLRVACSYRTRRLLWLSPMLTAQN